MGCSGSIAASLALGVMILGCGGGTPRPDAGSDAAGTGGEAGGTSGSSGLGGTSGSSGVAGTSGSSGVAGMSGSSGLGGTGGAGADDGAAGAGPDGGGADAGPDGCAVDAGLVQPPDSAPSVTVAVTLDTARAASNLIDLVGGVVSATGADGTSYDLIIPTDGLLDPTTVTLTPVSAIGGIPSVAGGQGAWGVQMTPDDLTLYKPATLVITPGGSPLPPIGGQLFVQWRGNGQRLELAPPDPTRQDIRLSVLHVGGGMGLVRVPDAVAGLAAVRAQLGGAPDERVDDMAAAYLQLERQQRFGGAGCGELPPLHDALFGGSAAQMVDDFLAPLFAAAGTTCAAGNDAIDRAWRFGALFALLGASDNWKDQVVGILRTVLESCMNEEFVTCRDQHVLDRMLRARLDVERRRALLGVTTADADATTFDGLTKGCLSFQLDVDSTGSVLSPQTNTLITQSMRARNLPLSLQGGYASWAKNPPVISGSGPFDSVAYTFSSGLTCLQQGPPIVVPATFTVRNLIFDLDDPEMKLKDFKFYYQETGSYDAIGIVDVCNNNTGSVSSSHFSADSQIMNHLNAWDYSVQGWLLAGWQLAPGQAQKSMTADGMDTSWTPPELLHKDATYVIRHVPSP